MNGTSINPGNPLRRLFKSALDFGFSLNPTKNTETVDYIEEQILCEFIHIDRLYKIRNASRRSLEDIANMLAEGDVLLNAPGFSREYQVHKHIGDFTLFMLGMFPESLSRKRGKEFLKAKKIISGTE